MDMAYSNGASNYQASCMEGQTKCIDEWATASRVKKISPSAAPIDTPIGVLTAQIGMLFRRIDGS